MLTKEALGKKRIDNDTRKALLRLIGTIKGSISESDCLEAMLRLWERGGGGEDPRPYQQSGAACHALAPSIRAFELALATYDNEIAAAKDMMTKET